MGTAIEKNITKVYKTQRHETSVCDIWQTIVKSRVDALEFKVAAPTTFTT